MNLPLEIRELIYSHSSVLTDKASILCKSEREFILRKMRKLLPSFDELLEVMRSIFAFYEGYFDFSSRNNVIRVHRKGIRFFSVCDPPDGKGEGGGQNISSTCSRISFNNFIRSGKCSTEEEEKVITVDEARTLWNTGKYRYIFKRKQSWVWHVDNRFREKGSFLRFICPEWSLMEKEEWCVENAKLLFRAMRFPCHVDQESLPPRDLVIDLFEDPWTV